MAGVSSRRSQRTVGRAAVRYRRPLLEVNGLLSAKLGHAPKEVPLGLCRRQGGRALRLVGTAPFPKGAVHLTYERAGKPTFGSMA
jgi:hypothetical protein